MKYLMALYRLIAADDIKQKKKFLQESLDTSNMIDVFFKIIYDRVQYSTEANTPLLTSQVLKMAYYGVSSYISYVDACKY